MLGDISGVREIYIVTGYTDMRKSIDGLCAIIEEQFSMNVFIVKYKCRKLQTKNVGRCNYIL